MLESNNRKLFRSSNRIGDLDPKTEWGFLTDSLSSLSLASNQLCSLGAGALSALHQLTQLDLEGNRLHAIEPRSLPLSLALLRLSDNLLPALPCAALAHLPRLRHLHLRGNALRATLNVSSACRTGAAVDSLDLAMNELDDTFELAPQPHPQLRRLILDLNDFTAIPPWVQEGGARLERLSLSHNRVSRVSAAAAHALRALARLDLDHNALRAAPDSLRALGALRRLDLAYNLLRELPHPPPHLRYLSLAGNLYTALPVGLQRLAPATLAYLDLGYNRISALSADSFGSWSEALGVLNLRGNRLTRLAVDAFPTTLPLRELMLSFNDLDRVEPGAFTNLTALQMLELSSTLFGGEFPAAAADSVSWLSLDNNDIHRVSADDLLRFPSLEYLNLDFNKITTFPGEAIGANGTSRLRELRLAYNYLSEIQSEFLRALPELQSVDLSYNRIRNVSARAFSELPALRHLSLAGNLLANLAPRAFCVIPHLEALDLYDNRLTELSTESFELLSGESELTVNASYNHITRLHGSTASTLVTVLDLSHNRLDTLLGAFFTALGGRLRRLSLTHNRFTHLDAASLGALPRLQVLALGDSYVVTIKRRALVDAPALQMLDLSRNAIQQLAVEQFHGLRQLLHLRLAGNQLRALPRDCLRNTVLEHLDLADNQLTLFPASALAAVGFTLRRLELARNRLEHLDAAMFRACAELRELSLAGNRLTALADNALAPLTGLRTLDLSGNRIKANFRELLLAVPRLRRLALADAMLRAAPVLPLPELVELDLSGNRIATLREADARHLTRLRTLILAGNAFTSLRPAVSAALPRLTDLDVSDNPIARLVRGSLEGLPRLRSLRIDRLRHLEAVEPRAFRALPALRELTLETPVGRTGASVADVVACTPALETLRLQVLAPTLRAQLRGVRARRLRALELRGAALRELAPGALAALGAARALAVRMRDTRVARLPAGLLQPLARVPHLALDFSDNELVEFAPAVLYPNLTGWNRFATKLLPGEGLLPFVRRR